MFYLVCYDIADPKRLQRVARLLEKKAVRCQKSVFLYRGMDRTLTRLLDDLSTLIDPGVDIVQAWKLARDESEKGEALGPAVNIAPRALILGANEPLTVDRHRSRNNQ